MADGVRLCVFLCFLYNFCAVLGSKEFFCQDPDTEELHHVNTTWTSTRFCGNYTCKLKKRNILDMETHASQQNYVISNPYENNKDSFPEVLQKAELSITTKRELPEMTTTASKNNYEDNVLIPKRDQDKKNDRYLNDAEIKSISELLHTIKKSDIDAIVEVYNLAQDIYKEMETTSVKNEVKFNEVKFVENKIPGSKVSYWYDPLYHTDFTFDRVKEIQREHADPVPSGLASNFYPIYTSPYSEKVTIPYTVQRKPNIPYYYPMPLQSAPVAQKKYIPVQDILRSYQGNYNQPCPWSTKILKKQYSYYPYTQPMETVAKLLPLPFSYFNNYHNLFPKLYRQNYTNPRSAYTKMEAVKPLPEVTEPSTLLSGLPSKEYSFTVTQKPTLPTIEGLENEIVRMKNIRDAKEAKKSPNKITESLKEKQSKLAPWQTLPLSQKILEEVKANILEGSDNLLKPFTLKKKLRLERVAKVLKLDEQERKKREIVEVTRGDVLEENDFEVYLEKITCEIGTDPGLFSLGDMSLPFPACCPQRLDKEEETAKTSQRPAESTTVNSTRRRSDKLASPIDSLRTNTLSLLNPECTEKPLDIPLTVNSSDVSNSSNVPTTLPTLTPTDSTETLKLTTNALGITTLSSTSIVSESTLKTSSSSPQTTTSDSLATVNSILTSDEDMLMSELSILPSKSSKVSLKSVGSSTTSSIDKKSVSTVSTTVPTVLTSEPTVLPLVLTTSSSKTTFPNLSTRTSSILNKYSHLKF